MSPGLSPWIKCDGNIDNKEGKEAQTSPLLQTTGLRLPFQARIPSVQPQGENPQFRTKRDSPSMKQVGPSSFRNEQINKQMGAWKEEMVYE